MVEKRAVIIKDGDITFLYTKRQFGNMSDTVGDTSGYINHRYELLRLLPTGRRNIRMWCEHKSKVVHVDNSTPDRSGVPSLEEYLADGFIADITYSNLIMFPANCVPLTIYMPGSTVVGYAHVSRHNATSPLLANLIDAYLHKTKGVLQDCKIYLGPCVHKEGYVFPPELVKEFFNAAWEPFISLLSNGKMSVDMPSFVVNKLRDIGVVSEKIRVDEHDTSSGEFYSQNRSHFEKEFEGRNAAAVFLAS